MSGTNGKHPFLMDPFAWVYEAYKDVFPDAPECIVQWDEVEDENGERVSGVTVFPDDTNKMIEVRISPDIPMRGALETLGHELAHVAAGVEAGHGERWEMALNMIEERYNRILDRAYRNDVSTIIGKEMYQNSTREPSTEEKEWMDAVAPYLI